ncbi:MAG: hypothetical protein COA47_09565 [Robiginitomaculum sp.]|nr:MAG: hypothetical protein COA47_09565 [Robiginitomaculum sp.]
MKPILFALLGAVLLTSQPALAKDSDYTGGRISLSATGKVDAVPDLATLSAGVITEGKTAKAALASNRTRMIGVFRALKAAGIKDRDMQTSGLNVSPVYAPYTSNQPRNEPRITGYRTSNQVSAIVRDLEGLGAAIDALVDSGANTIGGISFGLENPEAGLDQARRNAMKNLMAKARLYANAGNFRIGDIISMSESSGYRPQPKVAYARSMAMDSAPSPIAAGEVTSSITINATFEIEQ